MAEQIGWEQAACSVEELHCAGCAQVPEEQGVYFVSVPPGLTVVFQERFRTPLKGTKAVPYPVKTLEDKYAAQGRPRLLYIGKAGGRKGLRQRLRQYICCGYGETGRHLGGRAIWQVRDCEKLLISWEICPNPEQREHALLKDFQRRWQSYPVANWRS